MHLIRQSTASTVTVGPVLDSTGAAVTSAVVGDFRISKNGTTATLSGATVTHDANGYYNIALTTGNTDTAGRLVLFSGNTAQSMGAHRFTVLLPSVFDALISNATNATGGLPTATGAITALSGAISTFNSATNTVTLAAATHTGAVIPTVTAVTNAVVLPSSATINITGNITGNVTGSVGSVTGNVGGSVGSISGVTFPSNFSSLGINIDGSIAELGPQALSANSLEADIASQVWNTLTTGTFTDQSFGDRLLISTNNTREVAVTGSNHVAAVMHDAEPNSIPEDAFLSGAISARVIATDAIDADALADGAITSGVFAADSITATALATSAGEEIADKVWDEAISAHLASGSTGEALNNAGGSGNPWITDLSTGYTGTQAGNILNEVKANSDLISSIGINVYPVSASTPERVAGTTLTFYRDESRSVSVVTDFTLTSLTLEFVVEDQDGVDVYTLADGSISRSNQTFTVAITTAVTAGLGQYRWSMRDVTGGGSSVIAFGVLTVQEAASNA